jgi:ribosomal protein S18 acetylase RimI-like enzyme
MIAQSANYLDQGLIYTNHSQREFFQLFQTIDQVYAILEADQVVGVYWIEQRTRELPMQGYILHLEYQCRGTGSWVLQKLEQDFSGQVDFIKLGVHNTNTAGIRLYEHCGYVTVNTLAGHGFMIMQQDLTSRQKQLQEDREIR